MACPTVKPQIYVPFIAICTIAILLAYDGIFYYLHAGYAGGVVPWDGLRVTWNLDPSDSYAFASMPRTVNETSAAGFSFKDDYCQKDTKFRGLRYWQKGKPEVILLFDVAGYIAGIQTAAPKNTSTVSDFLLNHPVIEDGDLYTITAYFVDPAIICTTGRTADEFSTQGTGDRFVFQNGTNALTDGIVQPLTTEAIANTLYTEGKCLVTMGMHYYFNITEDMSCEHFFPFFLLVNDGQVFTFGFAVNHIFGVNLTSPRYEYSGNKQANNFIAPFPSCFLTDPTFANIITMHVYMTDSPRTNSLC